MAKNFNILVNKLNAFRIRYYTFLLLKGSILTFFLLIILFTLFSLLEYFVYFTTDVRKILFYGFLIFGGMLSIRFIFIPLLKLLHILKPIGIKESSAIIQNHFADIKDKLINVIELAEIKDPSYSSDILLASIDQKINDLSIFDFNKAVEYKNLRHILTYFIVSLLITITIFFVNRSVFTAAPQRIMHYNTNYVKPAPFDFHLNNATLEAKKGDPYIIRLECTGEELPQVVYINIEGHNYLMKSKSPGHFEFEMASVINPVTFYFTDLKYKSDQYKLQLLPKPGINHFNVSVHPPDYTGLSDVRHSNVGDLQVPNGTKVEWNFRGIDIDTLYVAMGDSMMIGATQSESGFDLDHQFYESSDYHVYIKNDLTEPELALSYHVEIIPDLYPEIKIVRVQDSLQMTRFFFKGNIGDDYGFSGLNFHYNIQNTDSVVSIPFVKNLIDQEFYFSFDFADVESSAGAVSYYFSVRDNDVINHYKTTTSNHFVFNMPDRQEIAESEKEQFKKLEEQLKESEQIARDIQQDIQNLRLKNMDTNLSEWEKTQMVNEILSKQNQLEKLYDRIKQNNEKMNNFRNSFHEQSEQIKAKQDQIEKLMEEVFTDELKKLLEEFQKLAEEFDQQKLNKMTEQMDLTYDDLQKQLDKNLEMLKKMKVEQQIQQVIDDLNRLAAEEEKMAGEISEKSNFKEMLKQVDEQNSKMEELQNRLKNALDMNNELDKPLNFDDFDEEFKDIEQSMQLSREALDKENRKSAGSRINETAEKMQNTAFAMQQMLNSNTSEQNMENLENLRQILSNLVYLSFQQEDVLDGLSGIDAKDPLLNEYNIRQRRIQVQSRIVRDSLYALAKRTTQITSTVNNELISMEINMTKALEEMSEGQFSQATASQQYVMTAANNLALLLNEALENLEKQMAESQPGDQNCEKPGQGQGGMNMLQKQSENLRQQLQQMIDQMKSGNKQQMGQQMGQSMMQHEMMQQMLREIMNNGNVGSEARDALKQIDNLLEHNRKQLMNKNVNAQMIARQNEITTRLLEAEKAELEREYEDERESKTAEEFYSDPVEFFEYENMDQSTLEFLNRNSHRLNNFYNTKYKQYLNNMEK